MTRKVGERSSLIKRMPDAFQESINEHMRAAGEKFRDTIRPVYGTTDKGTAVHIGSCTLLRKNGDAFLLTAAHVIDENKYTPLYVAGATNLVLIQEEFAATPKIDGSRENDHFDFAIAKLSKNTTDSLGAVRFISAYDISGAWAESPGHVFMAMGCPHSKNRNIDNVNLHIRSIIWKYSATAVTDAKLAKKLGVTGKEHVFIKFNKKYSQDENGGRVNSVNPRGMSGGALFDLGNLADPWTLEPTAERRARLTGLLIELPANRNLMVSTRIDPILRWVT
jgi:hypothetical protein